MGPNCTWHVKIGGVQNIGSGNVKTFSPPPHLLNGNWNLLSKCKSGFPLLKGVKRRTTRFWVEKHSKRCERGFLMTMFHSFESESNFHVHFRVKNFHSKTGCPAFHSLLSFSGEFPLVLHLESTATSFGAWNWYFCSLHQSSTEHSLISPVTGVFPPSPQKSSRCKEIESLCDSMPPPPTNYITE